MYEHIAHLNQINQAWDLNYHVQLYSWNILTEDNELRDIKYSLFLKQTSAKLVTSQIKTDLQNKTISVVSLQASDS